MTKEQLIKILKDNNIRYDKDVEKESTEGFVNDECAKVAEELYGDLYKIAMYGIQNGFSKCEDDIYDLTKLIASLVTGISRKQVNLAKTDEKRQKILKGATYLRREINMQMLNQLMSNLNACISAADAIMIIRKDNEALCARLTESKEVLAEIKETLSHAADVTSKNAAEYQVKIFDALMEWREAVSRYNCYSDTIDGLRGALDAAKDWQKLSATVRKNAKMGVDFYEYRDDYDEISLIINAARFAERCDGLRSHLNDYRNQTELLYNVAALREEQSKLQAEYLEERNSINARLSEIKAQTDSILNGYQNGTIDAVEADMKVADLDGEAADLEERLQNAQSDYDYDAQTLSMQISDAQSGSGVRDKIAKNFESFVKRIEAFRSTDPAMFVILCERIDFNGVYDTLTGRLGDKEIEDVYTKVETVIRETEEDIRRQRDNLHRLVDINDKMREKRVAEERILREQEQERRARMRERSAASGGRVPVGNSEDEAKKRLESRLARRAGTPVVNPNENANENKPDGLKNDDK